MPVDPYAAYGTLQVGMDDGLLDVCLNRPAVLNAVDHQMHHELEDIFARVSVDPEVRAVLLHGAGKSFCAGADFRALAGGDAAGESDVARANATIAMARRLVGNLLAVPQPIVAAVSGHAFGVGANLALFCDIVLAATDAVFADNHVNVGLVAGDGGSVMWPLLLPVNTAKYYLLTGDRIDGCTAERLGLVHRALPGDELIPASRALAQRLAAGPALALAGTKRAVNQVVRHRVELTLDVALACEAMTMLSADHREAAAAFLEKRPPLFRGC